MERRQEKGYEIAKTLQIQKDKFGWIVPSQTDGRKKYLVNQEFVCDCADSQLHKTTCKHAYAVRYMLKAEIETPQGTQSKRMTYQQTWATYDKCQINEKDSFMKMLNDLCEEAEEQPNCKGRPKIANKDLLFASALKVYTQFSLRRFMSDLRTAKEKGYVEHTPCFASVGHFMQKEELTPILSKLIQITALPMKAVEKDFAIDSSGFRTTKFSEYCKMKHNLIKKHNWIKCHIMTGVKTNIITAVEVNEGYSSDSQQFIPLVKMTSENGFNISEVSADLAYSSRDNLTKVREVGGIPFIPFKRNAVKSSVGSIAWKKMYHYFMLNREDFMAHYHKRSNVESTFFMLKAKFSDMLKSKTKTAQINELLLKVLCHNIVVVNNETNQSF
ncbi:MAG: transposase [Candidatus Micrarchaeota archaeon]|nr:transposase [Candidatus Micrarchaeota archaeon]